MSEKIRNRGKEERGRRNRGREDRGIKGGYPGITFSGYKVEKMSLFYNLGSKG